MAGGWRRGAARSRLLRVLLRDTVRALRDLKDILHFDPDISTAVQEIGAQSSRPTALVILGTSPTAKARLLHSLLGRRLLPEPLPRGCRWLRIQYGSTAQVHLTLGNSEFELVEDLECNKQPWDTLPLQDLMRQDEGDISTILEVELNISFLKDGLRIIVPPDIAVEPQESCRRLKEIYSELYTKRAAILKNVTPIYMYAIDRMGPRIFAESISSTVSVEEDFWSTFNLYYMARGKASDDSDKSRVLVEFLGKDGDGPAVFNGENCLDFHQVKELDPHSQFLFILFSNTPSEVCLDTTSLVGTESTESARTCRTDELPESDRDLVQGRMGHNTDFREENDISERRRHEEQMAFMNELLDQWELISNPPSKYHVKSQWMILDDVNILQMADKGLSEGVVTDMYTKRKREGDSDRCVKSRNVFLNNVLKFATESSQSYLLEQCTKLSEVHVKLLQQFILASFDMARELQVVPKKIQYVARQEQQLYETINQMFSEGDKKQELIRIMEEVLEEMKSEVNNMDWSVDDLPCHQDKRFMISNSIFYSVRSSPTVSLQLNDQNDRGDTTDRGGTIYRDTVDRDSESDAEEAVSFDSYNFDDYEIIQSNDESLCASECYSRARSRLDEAMTSPADVHVENESAAFSLSQSTWRGAGAGLGCSGAQLSVKQASLDVQQTVLAKLSRKISLKLVKFVDCLKDTYFGTLQRCLESLERWWGGAAGASEAARQLARASRRVELRDLASFSVMRALLDSLRRFFQRLSVSGGGVTAECCTLSPLWRRRVALHTLHELQPHRLARVISAQILERLSEAHERYQSALASLENSLANRLHHTEDMKLAIRKKYAPSFARLCLESTSMCDLLMYGTPELGREIGRGQYGVVYAVRGAWAGHAPAAVKSVLPADERHYHELAMEFFYTRSIPPHPRIVRLLGSLVQRGGGGGAPGVLLVSPRYARDLHAAVRAGLAFATRMRISCDIVEGIRYLHSLGLVHRDVKMKNVLLDAHDRAALSDLGFCAAEALMSGSVVGTPVHMAPELLLGEYDAAVDVYAFGILFWYVCAGNIKLPSAFEAFQNKEQLWSKVKRGLRPERLPHFTDECWEVMQSCWASEPSQRALLGDVQLKLEAILDQALKDNHSEPCALRNAQDDDDDTLDMTGIYDRDT
ncbi:dual serine/threonine and tyrosine protein kinase-like [Epargyreus clarus]|uniref:dual serine/threonine and tyrosine protein kinase-like n=1 Tax=Epargyreus clarus TaxID=520877 RepID=UPI003C309A6A